MSSAMYAQFEYFAYNDPSVINITDSTIEQLTSKTWHPYEIVDIGRHDTIVTSVLSFSLRYNKDRSYILNSRGDKVGRWKVTKGRCIEHSTIDSIWSYAFPKFGGIYGIVDLNDTLLHITKIQTSIHDVRRDILLSSTRSRPSMGEWRRDIHSLLRGGELDPVKLDSISRLGPGQLFFHGIQIKNDSILIQLNDSIIKHKWQWKLR